MYGKRVAIEAKYQGVDITKEVNEDLLGFEYVDHASGDSDSVSLDLKDENKIWLKDWFPEKGDVILPIIKTTNWRADGDEEVMPCGRFYIDEPSYGGRPSTFSLKAVSSPLNGTFTEVDRSKVWRNISLKAIGEGIARRVGLSLKFFGNKNPIYSEKEQSETTDASFLADLCEKAGLATKVTDASIVIFDEQAFETKPVVATYQEWGGEVLDYQFQTSLKNTKYAGVKLNYYHPKLGKTIEYLYSIDEIEEDSKIYQINQKVSNGEEARQLAQSTLRKLNKEETTGSLKVIGNVDLLGSSCVDLKGFGFFDGKYYVTKASHSLGSGYTTDIEVRKVLEGY